MSREATLPCPYCGGEAVDSDADGIAYCKAERRLVAVGEIAARVALLYPSLPRRTEP